MNKDSRVKDKLTGEIIDKSLSLSVKPRGKSRFIYFKNKENMETYLISLYIKDSDTTYKMEQIYKQGVEQFVQFFLNDKFKSSKVEYHEKTKRIKGEKKWKK